MKTLKITGFKVRSDKGTFEHNYDAAMTIQESRAFVDLMTQGHKDVLAKHFTTGGTHVPH